MQLIMLSIFPHIGHDRRAARDLALRPQSSQMTKAHDHRDQSTRSNPFDICQYSLHHHSKCVDGIHFAVDGYLSARHADDGERAENGNAELTVTGFLIGFAIAQLVWGPISDSRSDAESRCSLACWSLWLAQLAVPWRSLWSKSSSGGSFRPSEPAPDRCCPEP